MPRRRVPELVQELTQELRKGLIFEAPIVGSKDHIEGLCSWDTQEITVNPSVSVVDTLVHELLHRRFPAWSEDQVRRETWRVMKSFTAADIRVWYQKYKRLARRKSRPVRVRSL